MRYLAKNLAISFRGWYSSLTPEEDGRITIYDGCTNPPPRPQSPPFTTPLTLQKVLSPLLWQRPPKRRSVLCAIGAQCGFTRVTCAKLLTFPGWAARCISNCMCASSSALMQRAPERFSLSVCQQWLPRKSLAAPIKLRTHFGAFSFQMVLCGDENLAIWLSLRYSWRR